MNKNENVCVCERYQSGRVCLIVRKKVRRVKDEKK